MGSLFAIDGSAVGEKTLIWAPKRNWEEDMTPIIIIIFKDPDRELPHLPKIRGPQDTNLNNLGHSRANPPMPTLHITLEEPPH